MCGRYVSPDQAAIERWIGDVAEWWHWPAHFDASPGQELPILTAAAAGLHAQVAHWSLLPERLASPSQWRYASHNLRIEKLGEPRSMAARRFHEGRCLVPMLGFYEWPGLAGGKQTLRAFIHPAEDALWMAAGLCSRYRCDDGQSGLSFAILTGPANVTMARLHNRGKHRGRMPVLVGRADCDAWLHGDSDEARRLLMPLADDRMQAHVVARHLGDVPAQIEPVGEIPWHQLAP